MFKYVKQIRGITQENALEFSVIPKPYFWAGNVRLLSSIIYNQQGALDIS